MTEEQIRDLFRRIKVWRRRGERAPHKPLVILYMIGRLYGGEPRLVSYEEARPSLDLLLRDFGPPWKTSAAYPFVYLRSDGFWDLRVDASGPVGTSPSDARLVKGGAQGGFTEEVFTALKKSPDLGGRIVSEILYRSFPETIHQDILQAVGVDPAIMVGSPEQAGKSRYRRACEFRNRVLEIYEFQSAVCGLDVCLGGVPVGLEAAHIRWCTHGGPDTVDNGLLLCATHHKLFDLGVFGLDSTYRLLVSQAAYGRQGFKDWLMRFHGNKIRTPDRPTYKPNPKFIDWHVREVFRGEFRYTG